MAADEVWQSVGDMLPGAEKKDEPFPVKEMAFLIPDFFDA